jgi:hypothetical protein
LNIVKIKTAENVPIIGAGVWALMIISYLWREFHESEDRNNKEIDVCSSFELH